MKISIAMLVLLALLTAFWFWPKPEPDVHLVILMEQQGPLMGRDESIARVTEQLLGNEREIPFRVTVIDSSLPAPELMNALKRAHQQAPVHVALGCGDSVCVRSVLPWLEEEGILLLYPGSSEGLLDTRLVVHAGLTANQYLYPALHWLQEHSRRLLYLGSNSARSYMQLRIIQEYPGLQSNTSVIGYEFINSAAQLPETIAKIRDLAPDAVLIDICEWLHDADVIRELQRLPGALVSVCVDKQPPAIPGLYYLTAYNAAVDHPQNRRLREVYSAPDALLINTEWLVSQLTAAIAQNQSIDTVLLQDFFSMHSGITAAGMITIDRDFRGSWQRVFLMQKQNAGDVLMWYSASPLRPVMFPASQAPSDWLHHLMIYWRNAGGFWRRIVSDGSL